MSSLINRKRTKQYILERVKTARPGWECTQVSKQALDEIEAHMRTMINKMIHQHPSIGKTFKEVM